MGPDILTRGTREMLALEPTPRRTTRGNAEFAVIAPVLPAKSYVSYSYTSATTGFSTNTLIHRCWWLQDVWGTLPRPGESTMVIGRIGPRYCKRAGMPKPPKNRSVTVEALFRGTTSQTRPKI